MCDHHSFAPVAQQRFCWFVWLYSLLIYNILLHTFHDPGLETKGKKMFAMRGNPHLNTPLHRAKGIKKLILIQDVFDVVDGALPRDFTAVWITLSLAVDGTSTGGLPGVGLVGSYMGVHLHVPSNAHKFGYYRNALKASSAVAEGYISRIISLIHISPCPFYNWSPRKPRTDSTPDVFVEAVRKWEVDLHHLRLSND